MLRQMIYTDHRSGRWERALLGGGHMAPNRTAVTQPKPSSAPEKQKGLSWKSAQVIVDEALGGRLFPHAGGMAWTPSRGYRLKPLERQVDRAFYALVDPDGHCDIVVATASGLHKPGFPEIPFSVMEKALPYSGGDIGGELVIPVRRDAGRAAPNTSSSHDEQYLKRMAAHMKHADPDEC